MLKKKTQLDRNKNRNILEKSKQLTRLHDTASDK